MFDAIIIGSGPAGISAAIYLTRANLRVLVLGKDGGSLERAESIENYYGFTEPMTGAELLNNGVMQAKRLGADVITDEVTSIEKAEHFEVHTPNTYYTAKAVLLATGKKRSMPKIDGLAKLDGKGVSFCAVCDGFLYRTKRLALIGSGDYAAHEYEALSNFSNQITVFTNGEELSSKFPKEVSVITDKIKQVAGENRVSAIVTEEGLTHEVDGVFVATGTASAADFARTLGVITEGDNIIVDDHYQTNIEGLFAAGDCIGGFLQVPKAVSDGAHAAQHMIKICKKAKAL